MASWEKPAPKPAHYHDVCADTCNHLWVSYKVSKTVRTAATLGSVHGFFMIWAGVVVLNLPAAQMEVLVSSTGLTAAQVDQVEVSVTNCGDAPYSWVLFTWGILTFFLYGVLALAADDRVRAWRQGEKVNERIQGLEHLFWVDPLSAWFFVKVIIAEFLDRKEEVATIMPLVFMGSRLLITLIVLLIHLHTWCRSSCCCRGAKRDSFVLSQE